jgi:hypothetical protein
MDDSFALWRWNPQSAIIVDQKWMKDSLQSVELKLPPLWSSELSQENFMDTADVLKQLESLISGATESESWMESLPLDLP